MVYKNFIKRLLDVIISLCALVILSPILIVLAMLIRLKLGSPIIFKQRRPGLNEEIFTMYKFRTMTDDVDDSGELLPDSVRLTNFNQLLRSTSLDELPELFNILKGDMSLVGPRPLAIQYLPYYSSEEKLRHSVRPGLTGLAQVNGRNSVTWEDRFRNDIYYVKNITFISDIKIVIATFKKVLERSGVGERGVDAPIDFDEYRKNKGIAGDENEH